jgi:hypothetical protein
MHGMLFGIETELAFAVHERSSGEVRVESDLLGELYQLARERLVSLPDETGVGMFLGNGARFYLDRGGHPEFCTPECQSPAEVVCWQLACERILAELGAELEKRHPDVQVALYRCNVDYSGSGETWGCHESYQHRRTHTEMAPQLIPHLISRLIFSGSGGFDNTKRKLEFLLSPRVPHLLHEVGGDTPERGIYNTRNESLSSGGFNRLHVICGESLCSELANTLKLGTTALVVRLVDAGVCRGKELALAEPIRAMRSFARDPSGRARAKLVDGRSLRAVEIQAAYLAMVEEHLGEAFMPAWAAQLCAQWRRVLEQLDSAPESLSTSLDWAIKYALFRDRTDRARAKPAGLLRATGLLRASGLGAELCEIDTRFGELSAGSLFASLDLAGVLSHRIPERGSVEDAMVQAPTGARAELRGRMVRELHPERERYCCRWEAIQDRRERVLDLRDPFATTASWRDLPAARESAARVARAARIPSSQRRIDQGLQAYNRDDLPGAVAALSQAVSEAVAAGDPVREASALFWGSAAHHDMGKLAAAESFLAPVLEGQDALAAETRIRAWTRQALILIEQPAPLAEIERAIEDARLACRYAERGMGRSRIALLEARLLGARGRSGEAILTAERSFAESSADASAFSEGSHLRWLVTFLLRAGRFRRALVHLDGWRERVGSGTHASYLSASLAVAESSLSLRLGRHAEALERASVALERSDQIRHHRCRLAACIALLESAAACHEFERAEAILEETQAWHQVEIGELRFELLRAEALVQLARGRGDCAQTDARQRADEMLEVARGEAVALDEQLQCERHLRELEEVVRIAKHGRP